MIEKGLVQLYTGDGKGKTTAAFGLALRTAGHGGKVLIYQFLKPETLDVGERVILRQNVDNITLRFLDEPWDMIRSMGNPAAIERVKTSIAKALTELQTAAHEKYYDLIILDEIVFCLSQDLAVLEDLRQLIQNKAPQVELILTGRGATQELIDMADLVTEMKLIKHPFDNGIKARKGIEY